MNIRSRLLAVILGILFSAVLSTAHARVFINFGIGFPFFMPFVHPMAFTPVAPVEGFIPYHYRHEDEREYWSEDPISYRTVHEYTEPTFIYYDTENVPLNPRTRRID